MTASGQMYAVEITFYDHTRVKYEIGLMGFPLNGNGRDEVMIMSGRVRNWVSRRCPWLSEIHYPLIGRFLDRDEGIELYIHNPATGMSPFLLRGAHPVSIRKPFSLGDFF
jgi:hypothetical protein